MSLPTSPLAFTQCYDVMDHALSDPLGIRMRMKDHESAMIFRMRCHRARVLDREKNATIYPDPEAPLHNRSAYDVLIIRDPRTAPDGQVYLVIERGDVEVDASAIEKLSEVEPIEFKPIERLRAPTEQLVIEGPKVVRRR